MISAIVFAIGSIPIVWLSRRSMQRLAHSKYAVFILAVLAFSSVQSATEPPTDIEVGRHYLDALYAFDLPLLEGLLHADAVFEDPTSVAAAPGGAWRFEGRSAVLDFVRQTSASIEDADYQVQAEFSTGKFVVFYIEYSTVFAGELVGVPEEVFSIKVPAVTILRIQNGLVIHHTDHVDYDLMLEQIAEQSK
jgi:ketosteroid isomerase-like protein